MTTTEDNNNNRSKKRRKAYWESSVLFLYDDADSDEETTTDSDEVYDTDSDEAGEPNPNTRQDVSLVGGRITTMNHSMTTTKIIVLDDDPTGPIHACSLLNEAPSRSRPP
jgi:hypothetical protein